jgi:hypothetical protein
MAQPRSELDLATAHLEACLRKTVDMPTDTLEQRIARAVAFQREMVTPQDIDTGD